MESAEEVQLAPEWPRDNLAVKRVASALGGSIGWIVAIGVGLFGTQLYFSRYLFGDTYLDLAAGRYIASHGIPHREVFTLEGLGRRWIDQQWLAHWLYYEAWATAGILFVVAWLLVRGRIGRAWRSIRDGEIAAVSSGVNPAVYKTLAFGISSAYAGVAGALFAIQVSYINPDTFPVTLSILLLASVVIGGLASLSGVVVGALVLEFLPIYAQQPPVIHLNFAKEAAPVVFGVVLMIIVFLIPSGAAGLFRRLARPLAAAVLDPRAEAAKNDPWTVPGHELKEEES